VAIASGVIVGWPSTAGSIPANWTRVTALDDKYPRGVPTSATNPGSTGGSNSHSSHQIPSHNHGGSVSHTHPNQNSGNSVGSITNTATSTGKTFVGHPHSHTITPPAATMSITAGQHSFGANSAEQLHRTVIWIQSNGSPTEFPSGCNAIWNTATAPTNWSIDTNFQNRYARGAAGGAGGGSAGGTATHTHNVAASQAHLQSGSHIHGPPTNDGSGGSATSGAVDNVATSGHIHGGMVNYSLSTSDTDAATGTSTADAGDPPYHKLHYILASASAGEPAGIICLWIGTIASIPAGWILCDGSSGTPDLRDKFVKGALNDGERGSTGGASTHGHGTFTHTHLAGHGGSHSHSATTSVDVSNTVSSTGSTTAMSTSSHTHTIPTLTASTTAFANDTGATVTSDSSIPAYYTVAFIQLNIAQKADSENLAVNVTEAEVVDTVGVIDTENLAVNVTELEDITSAVVEDAEDLAVNVTEDEVVEVLEIPQADADSAGVKVTEAESIVTQDDKADAENAGVKITEVEALVTIDDKADADSAGVKVTEVEDYTASGDDTDSAAVNITEVEELATAQGEAENLAVNITEADALATFDDKTDTDNLRVNVTEAEALEFTAAPQLRRVMAEAYTAAGEKLPFGPMPILALDYTLALDKIGDFRGELAANNEKAQYLEQGYELRFYREGEGLIFRGIIDGLEWRNTKNQEYILEVTGQSIARQLVWKNTLLGMQFANVSVASAAATLLATTGWAVGTVDTITNYGFTARMDGLSRFEGLAELARTAGIHVRENNVTKEIDVTAAGVQRSIVLQNVRQAYPNMAVYPISEAALFEESADLWNYLIPLGQGEGINALDLRMATRPIQLCANPSFETNTTGWSVTNATIARVQGGVAASKHAQSVGRVSRTAGTEYSATYTAALTGATAGRTFAARVYLSVAGTEVGKAVKMRLRGTGGASGAEQTEITQTLVSGWNYLELEYTLVANDRTAVLLVVEQQTAVASETFDLDAIVLAEKTLEQAPYHILTSIGPDNQIYYYLADENSIAAHGQRERVLSIKEVVPLSPVSLEVTRAANTLYDYTLTALQRGKQTAKTYRVLPVGLEHYAAGVALLEVGDRVRVVYHGDGKTVDELMYVMSFTRSFEASGADAWDIIVSTVDRDPDAESRQQVDEYASSYAVKTAQKAYTFVDSFSERRSIDATHDVTLIVDLWNNVQYLHKAELSVSLKAVRTNASGVASGGGSTSGSGGGVTSSGGSSHSHGFSGGTVASGGGSTSGAEGSHRHLMWTVILSGDEWWTGGTLESTSHGHTENTNATYVQNAVTASNSVPHTHPLGPGGGGQSWSVETKLDEAGSFTQNLLFLVPYAPLEDTQTWTYGAASTHTHTTPNHTHSFSGGTNDSESAHTHTVSSHTHTTPAHTHALEFGIFEGSGPSSPGITVTINGVSRTVALGGPFNSDFLEKDITAYLIDSQGQPLTGRNTITFTSSELLDLEAIVKTLQTATSVVPI